MDGSAAFLEVTGPDAPADATELAAALAEVWNAAVALEVGWVSRQDASVNAR